MAGRVLSGATLFLVVLSSCSSADRDPTAVSVRPTVETTTAIVASSAPARDDLLDLATRSGNGDPTGVPLPAALDDTAREWLDGAGSASARMVDVTEPLWSSGSTACAGVAVGLDALGSPEELLATASSTPDAVTSELLVGLQAAAGRTLAACTDADEFDLAVQDFAWQWALANRRLDELGVSR